jgi:hypothetical protein
LIACVTFFELHSLSLQSSKLSFPEQDSRVNAAKLQHSIFPLTRIFPTPTHVFLTEKLQSIVDKQSQLFELNGNCEMKSFFRRKQFQFRRRLDFRSEAKAEGGRIFCFSGNFLPPYCCEIFILS